MHCGQRHLCSSDMADLALGCFRPRILLDDLARRLQTTTPIFIMDSGV
jgi:hypothetical protein